MPDSESPDTFRALTYWVTFGSPERKKFILKVYGILGVAVLLTFTNVMLSLLFISQIFPPTGSSFVGCVGYVSIALTIFFWTTISYICSHTELDFTVHKLFIWAVNLIWLFFFVGLWMFCNNRYIDVLWATLGMVITLMGLAVETQMVLGARECKCKYKESQYLLAAISLYWYVLLLFVLLIPILNVITESFLAFT